MPQRATSGGVWLLGATAVAGGLGYAMQVLAGLHLDAAGYQVFGVFWAALFFVAGTLSGVQQEFARASHPGVTGGASPLRVVAVLAAGAGALTVLGMLVVPSLAIEIGAVGIGAVGGIALMVASGLCYGARAWPTIASLMVLEAAVRLILLETALLLDAGFWTIALALAVPWAVTVLLLLPRVRRATVGVGLDSRGSALAANLARTIVGAAATSVIVSGFPFFMRASAPDADAAAFGAFVFAFTLTRAPLVVVFIALQSFLVKLFQQHPAVGSRLLAMVGGLIGITTLVAVAAALAGPWVLETFFGMDYLLSATTLFWIVASAAPVAIICVTGPLALARHRHSAFTVGWVVAAAVSLALLTLPLPFDSAALVAIAVGPSIGTAVHAVGIARRRPADDAADVLQTKRRAIDQ